MLPLLLALSSAWAQPHFPALTVQSLAEQSLTLEPRPAPTPTVVLVGFQRTHHADAQSWWPVVRPLGADGRIAWDECAFIGDVNALLRGLIFTSMRVTLRDDDLRHSFTPAFVDGGPWQQALELPDQNQLAVVLFDTDGAVHLVALGPHSAAAEARLRALLDAPAG